MKLLTLRVLTFVLFCFALQQTYPVCSCLQYFKSNQVQGSHSEKLLPLAAKIPTERIPQAPAKP